MAIQIPNLTILIVPETRISSALDEPRATEPTAKYAPITDRSTVDGRGRAGNVKTTREPMAIQIRPESWLPLRFRFVLHGARKEIGELRVSTLTQPYEIMRFPLIALQSYVLTLIRGKYVIS